MKRGLEPPVTEFSFPNDIALHIELDVVTRGGFMSLELLLAWHQTCRRYYRQWCDHDYLLQLLQRAYAANKFAFLKTRHGSFYDQLLRLDCAVLALGAATRIMERLIPKPDKSTDIWTHTNSQYHKPGFDLKSLFMNLDSERFKHTSLMTPKMTAAFRAAASIIQQRWQWHVYLRRGKSATAVEVAKELKCDDEVCMMLLSVKQVVLL